MKDITEEIVKKCKGLPLMINVIGKLLQAANGEKKKWKSILDKRAWKKKVALDNFKISYQTN